MEADALVVNFLNSYHERGRIPAGVLEPLRSYFHFRLELLARAYEKRGPDDIDALDFLALLDQTRDATESTVFARYRDQTFLYDTAGGGLLYRQEQAGRSPEDFFDSVAVQAELLGEVLLAVIGMVLSVPPGLKAAVKEILDRVLGNPAVRAIMKRIIELLKSGVSRTVAVLDELRKLLVRLFDLLSDDLWELIKKVFTNFSWKDILMAVLDILLWFTPIGWAKKAATVSVGFVGLGVSLAEKYEKFVTGQS